MPSKRGKRWIARGDDPITKKRVHLGTYATKREAGDAESDYRRDNQAMPLNGRMTCDAFAARWTTTYPRRRESTNINNAAIVKKFGEDFKGVPLSKIDRPTARKWALENKHRLSAVRAMFTDALNDGLCHTNPFTGLRIVGSKGRKQITALTETELGALADGALRGGWGDFGKEVRAWVLFAGYVGCRPGELYALRRSDVNGDFVTIERAFNHTTRGVEETKTGLARTVIVPPPALEALEDVSLKEDGLLFSSPRGRMWNQNSVWPYWDRTRSLFGRPGLELYELRHAAATILLERGVSPWDVAIQLGHSDGGQLVQQLYGHPSHANARARLLAAYGVTHEGVDAAPVTALSSRREAVGQ